MTIRAELTVVGTDDFCLMVHADTMNEVIEQIKEWQEWESMKSTLEHFKKSPEYIQEMRDTGFYYFKETK